MDPKQLSTQELEQLIRAASLASTPRRVEEREPVEQPVPKSTAVSLAMKSLQTRIAVLEDRNEQLSRQVSESVSTLAKCQQDNASLLDANRTLQEVKRSLEEQLADVKEQRRREAEQREILEDHRKMMDAELARCQQRFNLDREKLDLEGQHLKQLLGERVESERSLIDELKKIAQEKGAIEADLDKTKKVLDELRKRSEKTQSSLEAALDSSENEMAEMKRRFNQSLRDLERENKAHLETIKSQKDTISRLRHEHALKQKAETSRPKAPKPPRRQSFSQIEEPDRPMSAFSVKELESDEKVLEDSLARCNAKYKELLQRAQVPGEDVRRDLKRLAREMEEKSEALYAIKQFKASKK